MSSSRALIERSIAVKCEATVAAAVAACAMENGWIGDFERVSARACVCREWWEGELGENMLERHVSYMILGTVVVCVKSISPFQNVCYEIIRID